MRKTTLLFIITTLLAAPVSATAKTLTKAEIGPAMINKTLFTRRFGMSVRMVYRGNGTVTAKALLGTVKGTWRYKGANSVCTTFPSGPAKGTDCVSFTKLGANRYRSSKGVTFTVGR